MVNKIKKAIRDFFNPPGRINKEYPHLRSNKRGIFYVRAEDYLSSPKVQADLARTHEVFKESQKSRSTNKSLRSLLGAIHWRLKQGDVDWAAHITIIEMIEEEIPELKNIGKTKC